jgi:hypothetical protein
VDGFTGKTQRLVTVKRHIKKAEVKRENAVRERDSQEFVLLTV